MDLTPNGERHAIVDYLNRLRHEADQRAKDAERDSDDEREHRAAASALATAAADVSGGRHWR